MTKYTNFLYLICAILFACNIIPQPVYSQKIITLNKDNNVYKIQCIVNGIPMEFIFDTGASDVTISLTEARFLIKQGLLKDGDIKEKVKYSIANGNIEEGTKIILREVVVDGIVLKNVEASVVHNLKAPLLFGNNAINMLGKIVIENDKLLIYPDIKSEPNGPNQKFKINANDATIYTNRLRPPMLNINHDTANKINNKDIEYEPSTPSAYYIRAQKRLQNNDYRAAIKDFDMVIKLDPIMAVYVYIGRGNAKTDIGDFKGAFKDYSKFIELETKPTTRLSQSWSIKE